MAFTSTMVANTVHGNQRLWQGTITADAASGVVSFGFAVLTHAHLTPKSLTTAYFVARVNGTAAAITTTANGNLGISGVASGDEFYATVYGR